MKDEAGEEDAIGLLIESQRAQADAEHEQPRKALETALMKMEGWPLLCVETKGSV